MRIYIQISLPDFAFWSNAESNARLLSREQMEDIESVLICKYPDGISNAMLNELFSNNFDTVLGWINTDYVTLIKKKDIKQ